VETAWGFCSRECVGNTVVFLEGRFALDEYWRRLVAVRLSVIVVGQMYCVGGYVSLLNKFWVPMPDTGSRYVVCYV
jgi:hypothetical protein